MASAVMPYYTISFNKDAKNGENVGNAYSTYLINDLLRGTHGFDGVVCTDWGVTRDHEGVDLFGRAPWGVEGLSVAERHYKALIAGVDQFGGNNDSGPVIEAYDMGVREHGKAFMRARFEVSAVRLLKNIFRTGLFENPYRDVDETTATVGNPTYMAVGYEAQRKSLVLLKNQDNVLPLRQQATIYIPQRYMAESRGFFGNVRPARNEDPLSLEVARKYFNVTDDPTAADAAIIVIDSPASTRGYDKADVEAGGNGYLPISL